MKKKKRWPVVVAILAVCAVAIVFVVPRVAGGLRIPGLGNATATVQTVSVEAAKGDVVSSVVATGNLSESVTDAPIPYDVEVDSLYVAAGDYVAKDDAIALLDSSSLTSSISDVRDDLSDVNDDIEDIVDGDKDTLYLRSKATARVKGIYIDEGDKVKDKAATDGALILLSLDGLMSVDISSDTKLSRGDEVTVVLADGDETDGTVESSSDGDYTITLTDDGPALGEKVTVAYEEKTIGEGELKVHEPLKVTYGSGKVSTVAVEENEKVYNGTTLITIEKSSVDTGFASLVEKREALTSRLERLSELAVDRIIYAPVSGTVSEVAVEEGGSLTTSLSALTTSESAVMTIAAKDKIALSVDIDELDIGAISPGLETDVEVDAIEGETFHGSVVEVSDEADVDTGVAKYGAVIEIERTDAMKEGMSATATITKEKREGVITIPLDAVQEFGERIFVYTAVDGESGVPTGEQAVETGLSDGTKVEIVSGLNEGDAVYYLPASSDETETGQMGAFPMMGGGGQVRVVNGERPQQAGSGSGGAPPGGGSGGGAPSGG
ncbi:MAG: efflux RND transporter periplasmic adaptor subunit [Clostridiales Family XIII bacterium]|jgi:multidrug efflux pump subunit AcrA (membrane-fusion protein)|nr:efflux RND transporter periplasmic adaptor subunit [Clostridiales Family XIII bacterium]